MTDTIRQYFSKTTETNRYIETNPETMGGAPVIKNTRIPVTLVLACLKDGMSVGDIAKDYDISRSAIRNALAYAIEILDSPYLDETDG